MFSLYGDLPAPKNEGKSGEEEGGKKGTDEGKVREKGDAGREVGVKPKGSSWAGSSNKLLASSVHTMKKVANAELKSSQKQLSMGRRPAPPLTKVAFVSQKESAVPKSDSVRKESQKQEADSSGEKEARSFDVTRTTAPVGAIAGVLGVGMPQGDEYDPLMPNDYEKALEEIQRRHLEGSGYDRRRTQSVQKEDAEERGDIQTDAEAHRRGDTVESEPPVGRNMAPREVTAERRDNEPPTVDPRLKLSGEEAYERRAKLNLSGADAYERRGKLQVSGDEAFERRGKLQVSGDEAFERRGKLKVSGDEAFERRGKLKVSGDEAFERRANLKISGDDAFRSRAGKRMRTDPVPVPEPPAEPSSHLAPGVNRGAALMAAMGWQHGKGLGKDAQGMAQKSTSSSPLMPGSGVFPITGITQPIEAKAMKSRSGVGGGTARETDDWDDPEPHRMQSRAPIPGKKVNAHSRVILLTNMALPDEVDEDLEPETAEECSKYGRVEKCIVYEDKVADVQPEFAVRIFVKFSGPEAAMKALMDLDGRFFGGRRVRASFFSDEKFDSRQLGLNFDDDDE